MTRWGRRPLSRSAEGRHAQRRARKESGTDEPIRVPIATDFFLHGQAGMPETLELFGRFAALTRGMRRLGSTALDLFYVASGRLDDCYERGIWAWDIAAGSLILEEANGKVTDYRGGELDLGGREIVASNGALHPVLVCIYRRKPMLGVASSVPT
jgi:myo-inositol-1(or 4)-monophosphatase